MKRTWGQMSSLLLLAVLICGIGPATAGEQVKSAGTVTMTATSVSVGIGWTWGHGTLTLVDGSEYDFRINGLEVVAVGISQATAVGNVYYLSKPQDFEGKYVAVSAGAVIGGGAGIMSMKNDQGVVIIITGVGQGVSLNLSVSGMSISDLKKKS
jgi:hypothetical protein